MPISEDLKIQRQGAWRMAVICIVLCCAVPSAWTADLRGYYCMGYPVEGDYPFATVHVASNLNTDPNAPFRLIVRVIISDPYIVWPEEIILAEKRRKTRLRFTFDHDKRTEAIILTMKEEFAVRDGQRLLIRFLVDGEILTVTAGLVVEEIFL